LGAKGKTATFARSKLKKRRGGGKVGPSYFGGLKPCRGGTTQEKCGPKKRTTASRWAAGGRMEDKGR